MCPTSSNDTNSMSAARRLVQMSRRFRRPRPSPLIPDWTAVHEARFWSHVGKPDANGCHLWDSTTGNHGYGVLAVRRRMVTTHRVAYVLAYGAIPKGLLVCHRCDVRTCCNPEHLFLGTHGDNNRDRAAKGRNNTVVQRGTERHNAIVTEQDVRDIRAKHLQGQTYRNLAAEYGFADPTGPYNICTGKTWRHVV